MGEETLLENRLFKLRNDLYRNPRTGNTLQVAILESKDAANVVAFTPDGKLVLVHQFRFGTREWTLEIPGGQLDNHDEPPLLAAQRELAEETGYTGGEWTYLGKVPANPVFMDNYIHHWLARGVAKTQATNFDEGEDIEIVALPLDEVAALVREGKINHPHTLSALARVMPLYALP